MDEGYGSEGSWGRNGRSDQPHERDQQTGDASIPGIVKLQL